MSDEVTFHDGNGQPISTLRKGPEFVCVNPFAPEEEWLRVEEFAARQREAAEQVSSGPGLRITKIDVENRTVTLE